MKFKKTEVSGFRAAFRGMRAPLESWSKSDSIFDNELILGLADLRLAERLIKGGTEHRKFLRYIHVSVDITAPIYWWKEMDTYKIGTTANSTSTMHKLASTPITQECFEMDDMDRELYFPFEEQPSVGPTWLIIIDTCEKLRQEYNKTKDKRYWKELIRILPES